MTVLTAHECQSYAIGKARERRAVELAPIRTEVDRLVAEVGWRRARPVLRGILGPHVLVSRPAGKWRARVGKRAGARIAAALSALPVQKRFPLSPPSRSAHEKGDHPCTY